MEVAAVEVDEHRRVVWARAVPVEVQPVKSPRAAVGQIGYALHVAATSQERHQQRGGYRTGAPERITDSGSGPPDRSADGP